MPFDRARNQSGQRGNALHHGALFDSRMSGFMQAMRAKGSQVQVAGQASYDGPCSAS